MACFWQAQGQQGQQGQQLCVRFLLTFSPPLTSLSSLWQALWPLWGVAASKLARGAARGEHAASGRHSVMAMSIQGLNHCVVL